MLLTLQRYQELENKKLTYHAIEMAALIRDAIREQDTMDDTVSVIYPERSPIFYGDERLLKTFLYRIISKFYAE